MVVALFSTGGINTSHQQASYGVMGNCLAVWEEQIHPHWVSFPRPSDKECSPLARFLEELTGQMPLLSACHQNNGANGWVRCKAQSRHKGWLVLCKPNPVSLSLHTFRRMWPQARVSGFGR